MSAFQSIKHAAILLCTIAFVGAYHAGQRTFDFQAPQALMTQLGVKPAMVHGVVWYPAPETAQERVQHVGPPGDPLFTASNVAIGAPIAPSPQRFGVILVSHGTGGAALQIAWLGAALARAGYIAVAIDHPGDTTFDKTVQGFVMFWLRPAMMSVALDRVLADPVFGPRIDPQRVGAAGFSIGGYSVLGLAGATVDEPQFQDACAANAQACDAPPEYPNLLRDLRKLAVRDPAFLKAITSGDYSERDPRVRAVYAIAPAVRPAITQASLTAIDVPVRIAYGTNDTTVPPALNALSYASAIPGATLVAVPGAAHYTFLDDCTSGGRAMLARICTDAPGVDRARVHQKTADDAAAFFARTLGP